jgi:hypothetical protein
MSKRIINGRRTNGKVDRTGSGQICMLGMRELAAEGTPSPYQQKESEEAIEQQMKGLHRERGQ